MGYETIASEDYSTAMGNGTTASGIIQLLWEQEQQQVVVIQLLWDLYTTASGFASTAMGDYTKQVWYFNSYGYFTKASGFVNFYG